jgi:hypothetical protein
MALVPDRHGGQFVLNTPLHHRGRHCSNQNYLDKKYRSITIMWDGLSWAFLDAVASSP